MLVPERKLSIKTSTGNLNNETNEFDVSQIKKWQSGQEKFILVNPRQNSSMFYQPPIKHQMEHLILQQKACL